MLPLVSQKKMPDMYVPTKSTMTGKKDFSVRCREQLEMGALTEEKC
jgi:hypothetical protein